MGLRLYQAPVESDIQQKPLVDKGPAQARSTIRRHRLARGSDLREQTRERRRRFLASSSAYLGAEQPTSAAGLAGLDYTAPAAPAPTNSVPNYARRAAMIDMVARTGVLDDRVAALFDDRFPTTTLEDVDAIEHRFRTRAAVAASRDRQERQERRERRERDGLIPAIESYSDGSVFIPAERLGPLAFADEILGQERSQLHQTGSRRGRLVLYDRTPSETRAEPYTLSSIRSTQAPDHPSRSSTASPAAAAPPFRRPPPATVRRESRSLLDDVLDWPRSSRRNEQTVNTASSRLDGLGDRNRSLSPEGDNVWDTLLTTLTPDPQPPSVGSSFASASATLSAATAAQTTAAPSSRTSFSLPEIAENAYLFDPLCEFNSDTDDDHNDNEDTRNSGSRPSQRWADIARYRNSEDNIYAVGNEAALQRIVRRIAQREQIPDSWWAEVGLTSSIGRDTLYRQAQNNSD